MAAQMCGRRRGIGPALPDTWPAQMNRGWMGKNSPSRAPVNGRRGWTPRGPGARGSTDVFGRTAPSEFSQDRHAEQPSPAALFAHTPRKGKTHARRGEQGDWAGAFPQLGYAMPTTPFPRCVESLSGYRAVREVSRPLSPSLPLLSAKVSRSRGHTGACRWALIPLVDPFRGQAREERSL